MALGRSFAYIGVPQLQLYVGEALLLLIMLLPATRRRLVQTLGQMTTAGRWHVLSIVLAALLTLGAFAALRGIRSGFDVETVLKSVPFNYYPVLLVVGAWWSERDTGLLPKATLWLAWVNGVYGTAFVLLLSRSQALMPGQFDVPLFGNGNASGLALLGLLVFHRGRRTTPVLMILNAFVLLGVQQRSEWLAFLLSLVVLSMLTRHVKDLLRAGAAVIALLAIIALAGVNIPGASHRGGEVSVTGIVVRMAAPVAPGLVAAEVEGADVYAATAQWRTTWWRAIVEESTKDVETFVLGHGYGYPLYELGADVPRSTRTPHNVVLYALAYSGWLGLFLVLLLFGWLGRALMERRRTREGRFGVALLTYTLVLGTFGNWFESPIGAVPTYLLLGAAVGAALPRVTPGHRSGQPLSQPWRFSAAS